MICTALSDLSSRLCAASLLQVVAKMKLAYKTELPFCVISTLKPLQLVRHHQHYHKEVTQASFPFVGHKAEMLRAESAGSAAQIRDRRLSDLGLPIVRTIG
jgi:hypothetical protein